MGTSDPTGLTGSGSRKLFYWGGRSATAGIGVNLSADANGTAAPSHAIPALWQLKSAPRLLGVCGLPSAVRDAA